MIGERKLKILTNMKLFLKHFKTQLCGVNKRYLADNRNAVNKQQTQLSVTKNSTSMEQYTPKSLPFYGNDPHDGVGVFMFLIAAIIIVIGLLMFFSQGEMPDNLTLEKFTSSK